MSGVALLVPHGADLVLHKLRDGHADLEACSSTSGRGGAGNVSVMDALSPRFYSARRTTRAPPGFLSRQERTQHERVRHQRREREQEAAEAAANVGDLDLVGVGGACEEVRVVRAPVHGFGTDGARGAGAGVSMTLLISLSRGHD